MNNIWSWDNCFNAMMLKDNFIDLALNQFEIFVEHQDEYGQYPDFINNKFKSFNCVKPPIHAFSLKKLMDSSDNIDTSRVKSICDSIEKSTYFWLNNRRFSETDFPFYHHGNDSGWDNSTIFKNELPIIAPDLTAYIIRQLDILSDIYLSLKERDKAEDLKEEADKLFLGFTDYFYNLGKNKFIAKTLREGKETESSSLILYLPIVIGYRFEKKFLDNLVKNLLSEHLTKYGLATENPSSPFYKYNGYWQGPIWAPTTYIFIDALRENGYTDEAFKIAEKFCELTLVGGMAENFDPHSGEGLVDKSFTWTSSVFLLLQKEFY
ncbi:MAG: amylo-alpha-1,6-glucosidase [Lachnospirales bacterium]